ncbi:hypothetical protein [Cupriavidus lacunae]|uniref:hypothetical protein n=1 Tax=Cupriavidus lacunae TaxID=2666307 RepID=UPI0010591D6A|nr:hypothetical protein [Cupriavidus lacunae]
MKRQPVAEAVSVEVDGKVIDGTYTVHSKVVTVDSSSGSGSTQLGGSPAPVVARILLREIADGAKARGDL